MSGTGARVIGRAMVVSCVILLSGCSVPVAGTASPAAAPGAWPTRAPTAPAAPAGPGFQDAAGRFRLVPPAGWTVDTSGAQGTSVVFLDPEPTDSDAGMFRANVNVLVVRAEADLDSTITGARQNLVTLPDYDPLADGPATLADGTPAYMFGGTFTDSASGSALRNLQLFTVHDGSTIVVTGTAPAGGWVEYAATFDRVLRTLTVT